MLRNLGMIDFPQRESNNYFSRDKNIKELSPKDFEAIKTFRLKSKKCTLVLFYAPWCGFCKATAPLWKEFGKKLAIDVAAFNCEKHSQHVMKMNMDKKGNTKFIPHYPTIVLYKNGTPYTYKGERSFEQILKFLEKKC